MSHHIYNTRGLVLASRPLREADRLFSVLTPDLGLVAATAQGVRKGNAKLGGVLLDLSSVKVSLVRGKHVWRITTAALDRNLGGELRTNKQSLQSLARVFALVERLVKGEEKHADLFQALSEDVELLLARNFSKQDTEAWEIFAVSHLLYHLGYLSKNDVPKDMEEVKENKKVLVTRINDGIHESGLA